MTILHTPHPAARNRVRSAFVADEQRQEAS